MFLSEGGLDLHVAQPTEPDGNSTQYFLSINGLSDFCPQNDQAASLVVIGDWEWQDLWECLSAIAIDEHKLPLGESAINRTYSGAFRCLKIHLLSKYDQVDKIRIKISFESQTPIECSAWRDLSYTHPSKRFLRGKDVAIYLSVQEFKTLLALFDRYFYEGHEPDVVFHSGCHHWAIPSELLDVSLSSFEEVPIAQQRLKNIMPQSLAELISPILGLGIEGLEKHDCDTCQYTFIRNISEHWRKLCLDCYLDKKRATSQQ